MKALVFFETLETIHPSTQLYFPEDSNPQPRRFVSLILHKHVLCACYKIYHTMQFYDFVQKLDRCSASLRQQLTAELILLSTKHRYLQALWLQTTLFFVR